MNKDEVMHKVRVDMIKNIFDMGWIKPFVIPLSGYEHRYDGFFGYEFIMTINGRMNGIRDQDCLMRVAPLIDSPFYDVHIRRLGIWVSKMRDHGCIRINGGRSVRRRAEIIRPLFRDNEIKQKISEMTEVGPIGDIRVDASYIKPL